MKHKRLFIMVVAFLFTSVFCSESFSYSYRQCGENVTYYVEDGILTISGYGEMHNYDGTPPWPTREDDDESKRIYKIVVEEGITYIGANAFHDMIYVTDVSLPSTLETIGPGAFYGCHSLKSIEFPPSLKSLGVKGMENTFAMFEYCSSLEKIIIPEDSELEYIEPGAFYESGTFAGLEIYIPEKVEEIGWAALDGMFSHIEVSENNKNYCSEDGVLYSKDMTTLISYPMLKKSESFIVPDTVTKIESRALHVFGAAYFDTETHYSTKTVELYIPDSVKEMGEEAFRTEMDVEVYFAGSEAEWNDYVNNDSIIITSDKIHFNYNNNQSALNIALASGGGLAVLSLISIIIKKKRA